MKRLLAVLLSLAMLLSLAACGGSAEGDPNAGKYIGISAAVGGFAMPMSDVYPGETWIELKSGGRGTIMLGGDDFSMKWALEGEEFTITIQGVELFEELGSIEACWLLELDELGPFIVDMDSHGRNYFDELDVHVAKQRDAVLQSMGVPEDFTPTKLY